MSWQNDVPGCFGVKDARFGVHPMDEDRAIKAIKAAKDGGAKFDDFEKEVVWHCYQKVKSDGLYKHVSEQVETAKKMWK